MIYAIHQYHRTWKKRYLNLSYRQLSIICTRNKRQHTYWQDKGQKRKNKYFKPQKKSVLQEQIDSSNVKTAKHKTHTIAIISHQHN
jgi:hypothetical protein